MLYKNNRHYSFILESACTLLIFLVYTFSKITTRVTDRACVTRTYVTRAQA